MQRMIEQLLDMTRARLAGGIPVTLSDEELPLAPVVAKILEEARAASPHAVIELEAHGDSRARIDSDRFEQVVSNLIGMP
jgi:two-component system sensor histidine kinase/response regulator